MKKILPIIFPAAVLIMYLAAAPASAQALTVKNDSGAKVTALYVTHAQTNFWDENILGGRILEPGDSFKAAFNGHYALYDLLAVFDDGREQPYFGLNVFRYSNIRLAPDGVVPSK